jgi:hypothetical protein
MSFVSTGQLTLDEVAKLVPVHARYEPNPSTRQLWDDRLGVYLELHQLLAEPVSRIRS